MDEYRAANLRNWESRVPVHAASRDYDLAGLAADPEPAERRRRLRPTVARRSHRPRRGAPPVPYRHRHGLARPARRPTSPASTSHRARWPSRASSRPPPAWTCVRGVGAVRRARRARRPSSTSCTPASAPSTGCPTSPGWARVVAAAAAAGRPALRPRRASDVEHALRRDRRRRPAGHAARTSRATPSGGSTR